MVFAYSTWNILEPLKLGDLGAVDGWGIAGWAHAKGRLGRLHGPAHTPDQPMVSGDAAKSPKHLIYFSSQQLNTITYLIGGLEHDFYGIMMVNDDK